MYIENKLSKDCTMFFTYLVWCVQLYNLCLHIKEVLVNLMMQNPLNKFNKEQEIISEIIIPIDTVSLQLSNNAGRFSKRVLREY